MWARRNGSTGPLLPQVSVAQRGGSRHMVGMKGWDEDGSYRRYLSEAPQGRLAPASPRVELAKPVISSPLQALLEGRPPDVRELQLLLFLREQRIRADSLVEQVREGKLSRERAAILAKEFLYCSETLPYLQILPLPESALIEIRQIYADAGLIEQVDVGESNKPGYTVEGRADRQTAVDLPPEIMPDAEDLKGFAAKNGFETVADLQKFIDKWKAAEAELMTRENTARATAAPRPDAAAKEATAPQAPTTVAPRLKWGKDQEPNETPPHFAARAYAGEIADGTFDKSLIRRDDKTLYQRLFRDKAWPELEALIASQVRTKSQRISQQLTERAERGESVGATRSEEMRLYEAARYRSSVSGGVKNPKHG